MKQLTPLLLVFIFISCEPNVEVDEEIIYDGNLKLIEFRHEYIMGGTTLLLDTIQDTNVYVQMTKLLLSNGQKQLRFNQTDIGGTSGTDTTMYFNDNDSIILEWVNWTYVKHTYVDYDDSIFCEIKFNLTGVNDRDNIVITNRKKYKGYIYPM
jgi:hypothetical protein